MNISPDLHVRICNLAIVLICLFVFAPLFIHSQSFSFRQYTTQNGLSSNTVYSVMQDAEGFMWFATDGGVCRFDGINFDRFTMEDGLSDNEVFGAHQDSHGRIWFRTFNGRPCYYFNEQFYNYQNDSLLKKAYLKSSIFSFFEDSKKRVWLGASNSNLSLIDEKGVTMFALAPKNVNDAGVYIMEENDGTIYALFATTLYRFDESLQKFVDPIVSKGPEKGRYYYSNNRFSFIVHEDSIFLFSPHSAKFIRKQDGIFLNHVRMDPDSNLVLCSANFGLLFIDSYGNVLNEVLTDKRITNSYRDSEGNLWVCSDGNGAFIQPASHSNLPRWKDGRKMENKIVYSMLHDSRNNLWFGCNSGIVFRRDHEKLHEYALTFEGKAPRRVIDIEELPDGRIALVTDAAIFTIDETENLRSVPFFEPFKKVYTYGASKDLIVDKIGGIWTCHSGSLNRFGFRSGKECTIVDTTIIFGKRTFCGHFDQENNLWLATIEGLNKYSYENGKYARGLNIFDQRVTDIAETTDGIIAAATNGFGILIIRNGKIDTLSVTDGLASSICREIATDGEILWVATTRGLSKVDLSVSPFKVESFGTGQGLPSLDIQSVMITNSVVFAGTDKGLSMFPSTFQPGIALPPKLYIRSVSDGKKQYAMGDEVLLHYLDNFLYVEFGAITFSNPELVLYQYSFSVDPEKWTESASRVLLLKNLPLGKHNLFIRARRPDSGWSDPVAFTFEVRPPFWKTSWFLWCISIFPLVIIFFWYRFKVQRTRKVETMKRHMLEIELRAMKAQMNPHFIFNVLNSVNYFISGHDPESAQLYLTKFSRLVRSVLDNSERVFQSLQEEIKMLNWYIELEQLRFEDRLDYKCTISSQLDQIGTFIPSMIIQPYVENAIKHGMPASPQKMLLKLVLEPKEDFLVCTIEDNGVGREEATRAGKIEDRKNRVSSTIMLNQRIDFLRELHNYAIEVSIEDLKKSSGASDGTKVTLIFPALNLPSL